MRLPKIGITLGDPGGIGPEIVLKALSDINSLHKAQYTIFGSSFVLQQEKKALDLDLDFMPFNEGQKSALAALSIFEVECTLKTIKKGMPSKENGQASFSFFKRAVEAARKGIIQALVTAPISKRSWNLAGLKWTGHTHFLSQAYPEAIMAFWSERLKIALYSHHIPLKTAVKKIKKENLLEFFLLLHQNVEKIQPQKFQYLVAGLNPHAGESGLLGSEEKEEIIPAIKQAQKKGMKISGPFPPDVVFRSALNCGDHIVIALYHDQGLIAFKLEAFERGVNLTLGLPFIRTSPDHGTAFDIAGKGMASAASMVEAIKLAAELSPGLF